MLEATVRKVESNFKCIVEIVLGFLTEQFF